MTSEHENRDFDFGFEPGIDTFAQGGVPTATAIDIDITDQRNDDLETGESSSPVFAILMIGVAAAIFALPYFF